MLKKGGKSPRHKVLPMEGRDEALPREGRVESIGHPRVASFGFLELYVPVVSTAVMMAGLLFCTCSLRLRRKPRVPGMLGGGH